MTRASKLIRFVSLLPCLMFVFGHEEQIFAQDVYNFYFQKPASADAAKKPEVLVQKNTGESLVVKEPGIATEAAVAITETPSPAPSPSTSTQSKIPKGLAQDKSEDFRHWNLQLMRTLVADAYSDVFFPANQRLGFQVGYRWNKYVGVETGTTIGMLEGQWSNETGTDLWQSTIPYFGIRLNPIHLNIFGSEVLELYLTTGGLIINAAFPGLDGGRNGYGYYGGGVRINFGETVGLDLGVKTLANDTRYGLASAGIDLRF